MLLEKPKLNIQDYYHLSVSLIMILIAVVPRLVLIGFVFMFLISIYGFIKNQFILKINTIIIAFILFYIIYCFGILFSNDRSSALKVLEYKLSFLLIPIVFIFKPKFNFKLAYPIIGLAGGIVVVSVLGFVKAVKIFQLTQNISESFKSSNICIDHPTYYSAMTTVAMAGFWFLHKRGIPGFTFKRIFPFLLFGGVMIFLSFSSAALLFIMIVFSFIVTRILYQKVSSPMAAAILIVAPFAIYTVVSNIPILRNEARNAAKSLDSYASNPMEFVEGKDEGMIGEEVRLVMWTITAKECIEHPMGVGTGNVDESLSAALLKVNRNDMAKKMPNNEIRYNPHNQFLHTALELGVIGLCVFLLILIKSIQLGIRNRNRLLLLVIACLSFNCLFESMLQRQTGIVFFTFWIVLLSIHHAESNLEISE